MGLKLTNEKTPYPTVELVSQLRETNKLLFVVFTQLFFWNI